MEKSRLMIGFKLLFSLVVCQFAVVFGHVISGTDFNVWYTNLQKPFFAVPFWLFIPMRGLILFLLGIALFMVLIHINQFQKVKEAFVLFMVQIGLNILLNIAFFGFQSPLGGAVLAIPTLILAIMVTRKSYQIAYIAGMFTLPYLVGVAYTLIFDFSLFIMNR